MSTSRLDAMYRSFLITKFFTKGWGKPENLRRLFEFRKVVSNRDECLKLVERDYPVTITKEQNLADCRLLEGYFTTPLERHLPGIVPQIAQRAHFQVLLPNHWPQPHCKPVCLHLAGTGDHFFWRRRNLMVKPLLKEAGIGGIILENPFYGLRKPTDQVRSSLHNVSDIFVMGGCLVLESLVLFHWCERNGLGPLGVTGLSMGGHMASLAATNWPKPLVLVPCLSWSTASAVFLQGVMSHSINWDLLEDQYLSDGEYKDKLSKMVTIVDQAFLAGKKFARTYTETMETATQSKAETAVTKAQNAVEKAKNEIIVSGKVLGLEPNHNKYIVNSEVLAEIEKLNSELKKLLDEDKISRVLFDKLTSNEKFELESEDIDCINKLDKANLKQLLLKCKVAEIKKESFPQVPPNINDSTINMNTYQVEVDRTTPKYEIPLDLKSETATSTITETSRLQPNPADGKERDPTVTADSNLQPILTATESKKPTLTEGNETAKLQLTEADEPTAKVNVQPTLTAKEPQATNKLKPQKGKSNKKSWNVSDLTSDLWPYIPFLNKSSGKKIDISKIHWRDREALQFMRGIMDECTHLSNFSLPFDTSLIIAVCAQHDAYVPREDVGTLEEIWPGAEVRYVDAGHVSAYILHQSMFRSCIKEAFERSKEKWIDGKHVA